MFISLYLKNKTKYIPGLIIEWVNLSKKIPNLEVLFNSLAKSPSIVSRIL